MIFAPAAFRVALRIGAKFGRIDASAMAVRHRSRCAVPAVFVMSDWRLVVSDGWRWWRGGVRPSRGCSKRRQWRLYAELLEFATSFEPIEQARQIGQTVGRPLSLSPFSQIGQMFGVVDLFVFDNGKEAINGLWILRCPRQECIVFRLLAPFFSLQFRPFPFVFQFLFSRRELPRK